MTNGQTSTGVHAGPRGEETAAAAQSRPHNPVLSAIQVVFGPVGHVLARLRDLAAAPPDAQAQTADDRPLLDIIAFREVLPALEVRHLLLTEIKELSRSEDADPERLAALQRQHEESLSELLEQVEVAAHCIHSRRHHEIRDMLENVVLFDNFLNDFYLRNICNTMNDAIQKAAREQ